MSVTIAIPFYNAERFLLDSIKSVFAQTYKDWELLLIDDGSTDNSLAIAKSIRDPRVRVFSDGKNKKLAARLNEVVTLAKYDIIARMDADDLMSPTRIEKQLKVLKENPDIDLVSTGVYSVTNDLKLIGVRWNKSKSINHKELLEKKGCGIVHASLLLKKAWLQRNNYDEKLSIAQDYELWLRASNRNDLNICLLQEPLYYYREEDNAVPKKILAAYKNERVMYIRYGGINSSYLVLKSYLKTFVVVILQTLNCYGFLLKRRSSKGIAENFQNTINKELKIINAVELNV